MLCGFDARICVFIPESVSLTPKYVSVSPESVSVTPESVFLTALKILKLLLFSPGTIEHKEQKEHTPLCPTTALGQSLQYRVFSVCVFFISGFVLRQIAEETNRPPRSELKPKFDHNSPNIIRVVNYGFLLKYGFSG